jgi:hypothetical protein
MVRPQRADTRARSARTDSIPAVRDMFTRRPDVIARSPWLDVRAARSRARTRPRRSTQIPHASRIRLSRATGSLLAVAAIIVPTAGAASTPILQAPVAALTGQGAACEGRVLSQPFSSFGDDSSYFPIANGSFESGASGWTLTGGAAVRPGGDPFVPGSEGASLDLPAGASATTPASCVDLGSPTLRFFARATGATIAVSVIAGPLTLPIGSIRPTGAWAPSPTFLFVANVLGLLTPSGTVNAAFRFSSTGGDARIDDVLIDPYRRV